MSVLITGAAGYIGSHIAWHMHDHAHPCVLLDDGSAGATPFLPLDMPFIAGDVGDEALLATLIPRYGVTAIIHLAAKVSVEESVQKPDLYYDHNITRTAALLRAARAGGVNRILFASTAVVYANPQPMPLVEASALAPISPYARSKRMVEWMLEDARIADGLDYTILRFFNAAGADPAGRTGQTSPRATHLIKIACEAALGRRAQLAIYGTDYDTPDGTCIRDYIHVHDLAEITRLALTHLEAGGESGVMNCGYGRGASVREVIAAVKRVSGVDFPVVEQPRRAGDPAVLIAGVEKLHQTLGWQAQHDDLETIIRHALDWERRMA